MKRRPAAPLLLVILFAGSPAPLGAQVAAAFGPAFPTSDFNGARDAGVGWMGSARFGTSLFLLGIQIEGTYSRFDIAGPQDAGRETVSRLAVGPTFSLQPIRLGTASPYGLAGVSFGRRREAGDAADTSWRFGYHVAAGVEFSSGPIKPFVELRYVSADAPGSIRDTAIPLLFGLRLF